MNKADEKRLIDDLWQRSGLQYLSDLKRTDARAALRAALLKTISGRYSVTEWNNTAQYLTGDLQIVFNSQQAAWQFLHAMCAGWRP